MPRVSLKPIPEYGDVMTVEEFAECCSCGGFIDYDGYGKYATSSQMTNIIARPSEIKKQGLDKRFAFVVWFNQ